MECNWCEAETDNEMELVENGRGKMVWVAYCDRCKNATEECFEWKKIGRE